MRSTPYRELARPALDQEPAARRASSREDDPLPEAWASAKRISMEDEARHARHDGRNAAWLALVALAVLAFLLAGLR